MLPRLFLLLQSLILISYGYSQTIDSLKTEEQALSFIRSLKAEYKVIELHPSKSNAWFTKTRQRITAFGATSFEKADFDHNGQMDLLFNGYDLNNYWTSLVVLSFGNDSFQIKDLFLDRFQRLLASKTVKIKDSVLISSLMDVYVDDTNSRVAQFRPRIDTLVWAFNEFMERTTSYDCTIEKVGFCFMPGFTFFPGMKVIITPDSAILWSAQAFESNSKPQSPLDSGGTFVSKIDSETSSRIFRMLKYMDFPSLKENYNFPATDQSTGVLEIVYDGTKTKKIADRGLTGTRALNFLEDIFINLRPSLSWKKIGFDPLMIFDCIYGSMMTAP